MNGRRIKGYDLLADYLWPKPRPNGSSQATPDDLALGEKVPAEFMIFLGDFIYADVPFYFGDNVETYRRLYRRNYQSPSFRKIYERLRESLAIFVKHPLRRFGLQRCYMPTTTTRYACEKRAIITNLTVLVDHQ